MNVKTIKIITVGILIVLAIVIFSLLYYGQVYTIPVQTNITANGLASAQHINTGMLRIESSAIMTILIFIVILMVFRRNEISSRIRSSFDNNYLADDEESNEDPDEE